MNASQITHTLLSAAASAQSNELELRTMGRVTRVLSRHDGVLRKLFSFPSAYQSAVLLRIEHGASVLKWEQIKKIHAGTFISIHLAIKNCEDDLTFMHELESLSLKKGSLTLCIVSLPSYIKMFRDAVIQKQKFLRVYMINHRDDGYATVRLAMYDALTGEAVCLISPSKEMYLECAKGVPLPLLSSVFHTTVTHHIERDTCEACKPVGIGCAVCEGTGIQGVRHVLVTSS